LEGTVKVSLQVHPFLKRMESPAAYPPPFADIAAMVANAAWAPVMAVVVPSPPEEAVST
jgi:hypothetical protein